MIQNPLPAGTIPAPLGARYGVLNHPPETWIDLDKPVRLHCGLPVTDLVMHWTTDAGRENPYPIRGNVQNSNGVWSRHAWSITGKSCRNCSGSMDLENF